VSDYVNADALLASVRARAKAANARADAARAKLGGASRPRRSLTDGLSVEEIERDTKSLRKILAVWKARRIQPLRSTLRLASGREVLYDPKAEQVLTPMASFERRPRERTRAEQVERRPRKRKNQ
jgi:hypothetical protein